MDEAGRVIELCIADMADGTTLARPGIWPRLSRSLVGTGARCLVHFGSRISVVGGMDDILFERITAAFEERQIVQGEGFEFHLLVIGIAVVLVIGGGRALSLDSLVA